MYLKTGKLSVLGLSTHETTSQTVFNVTFCQRPAVLELFYQDITYAYEIRDCPSLSLMHQACSA